MAQNVYDDIIATSPIHTTLDAALQQEGLVTALQTSPNITVFAPTNQAFDDLANALGTDINGLLALQNLSDILTYHVLGSTVSSSAINNGDRKSTRLNSSHRCISYAVFCLKKKNTTSDSKQTKSNIYNCISTPLT